MARGNRAAIHWASIACEDNAGLLALNLLARQVVQSFDVGDDPDVLGFDPDRPTLYVAGEAGIVSIFASGSSAVSKTGEGNIGPKRKESASIHHHIVSGFRWRATVEVRYCASWHPLDGCRETMKDRFARATVGPDVTRRQRKSACEFHDHA